MRKFRYNSEQLALTLPDKLVGAAFEKYMEIVEKYPSCANDFKRLRQRLTETFVRHKPLTRSQLWSLSQGKRSMEQFYTVVVKHGKVLKYAFINGLREQYKRALINRGAI